MSLNDELEGAEDGGSTKLGWLLWRLAHITLRGWVFLYAVTPMTPLLFVKQLTEGATKAVVFVSIFSEQPVSYGLYSRRC